MSKLTNSEVKTNEEFVPFAKPCIGEEEIAAVANAMRSGWLTTGPVTRRFEQDFAAFTGADHAVAVNSATAGLHLALEALGIGPGDKVLTTTFTFTATAEVVRYLGADPVFVDVDPATLNIDPRSLLEAAKAHPEAKAVIPVHFAGQACDMDAVAEIARAHNLYVVEDAAHALPTTYKGRMVGTMSDATVFSFYATKTIATGEGGMVTTASLDLDRRMRIMRLHGINRDVFDRYTSRDAGWYYEIIAPGFKYNLTDIASAIGVEQLKKANAFQAQRERISEYYNSRFSRLPVICPGKVRSEDVHAWHLYVLRLADGCGIGRDSFIERLSTLGVGSSVHFIPLHKQPYWRDRYGLKDECFPVASDAYSRCVSLPIWQGMSDGQVEKVADAVLSVFDSI